jgi:SOS response regulatory protein OraA/RecX
MYKRFHKMLDEDFINNQRWCQLNCTQQEYHECWNGGLKRPTPNEDVIEEFMKHKELNDYNIAEQYFNKQCNNCSNNNKVKNIRQKDVIAMNMKLYGRQIEKFKCKKCLMKELEWSRDEWNNQVARFKDQGCKLF